MTNDLKVLGKRLSAELARQNIDFDTSLEFDDYFELLTDDFNIDVFKIDMKGFFNRFSLLAKQVDWVEQSFIDEVFDKINLKLNES